MRRFYIVLVFVLSAHLAGGYTGAMMGVANNDCDDGQSRLEVDWNDDFREFTCPESEWPAKVIAPSYYEIPHFDPTNDSVNHFCMDKTIDYPDTPPLR
uniref:Secreted protein n=1 Tax=Plectus sambesii TaxID=2011161 RepID=A0A914VXC7_9BILA